MAFKAPGVGPVGSIGKPIQGILMKVLDENGEECAPGVVGEICCRPEGGEATVEYFGDASASRSKIKGGWNRSGDMGHRDAEGWLYFDYRKGGGIRHNGDFVNTAYRPLRAPPARKTSSPPWYRWTRPASTPRPCSPAAGKSSKPTSCPAICK